MAEQTLDNSKGQFKSRFGFLMASIGSAVGLGNLWAFPYKMGKNGGFAFLLIYLLMFATVGVVMMLTELSFGRKTGKGVIYAWRTLSNKYTFVGFLGWLSPLLILGFYCMLGGYCLKYSIANLGDIFGAGWGVHGADSGKFFTAFYSSQSQSVIFTIIFTALTVGIVLGGVSSGIEKFSSIAMPALFFMLVIVIIRSVTLPGAGAGLSFVFKPKFEVFEGVGWISVLASAGSQLFFSLSLAMGIMITFGSYMSKEDDVQQSAVIIPIADTIIAVMAAMATMPAVFAKGLEPGQGPGMLFVTLQYVFAEMGKAGPVFGFIFYFLVFIAAITSSISLVEAVGASLMDHDIAKGRPVKRVKSTMIVALIITIEGILISLDGLGTHGILHIFGQGTALDVFDLLSEGLMMPLGAFLTAVIFGWIHPDYLDDDIEQGGQTFKMKKYWHFCMKWIVPIIMALVLVGQIDGFFGLHIFS